MLGADAVIVPSLNKEISVRVLRIEKASAVKLVQKFIAIAKFELRTFEFDIQIHRFLCNLRLNRQ